MITSPIASGPGPHSAGKRSGTKTGHAELLLEIGTEELPSHFLPPALRALGDSAERLLKEHRLPHGAVRTFGSPRRMVLAVESVSGRQAATVKEVMGPSKAVAYDAAGQPTRAAIGFAGSQGVTVGGLEIRRTPKGEYVFAVRREAGGSAVAVLGEILPDLIGGLSFPKSMRWNETGMRFARPIRWLLTLYGGRVVGIQIGGIRASNQTFGHRFLGSPGSVESKGLPVKDLRTYMKTLERHGVIADQSTRRVMILDQLTSLTKAARGHLHRDEDLLEQAIYSVEYPHAILGEFEPHYLSLPKEVLMTAMKEHQGYFSLMGPDGALLPKFIAVTNMKLSNMRLIREGNERVLAARLADAKFFFEDDRKVTLADRVKKLAQVTFHQKLGTLHQKQERVIKLISLLAPRLFPPDDRLRDETSHTCRKAAQLCKADLLTGMVGEFPTLQGIIGGVYARHDGESEEVSRAIAEQYLPRSMDGDLPQTLPGKILSLADRLDTIAAFFHVGIVPTGSEDPFALRRHATAIVRILIEGNLRMNLGKAIDNARNIVADDGFQAGPLHGDENRERIVQFIFERVRYYGRTVHGLRDDVMEAVLKPVAAGACDLVDLHSRMKAIQAITVLPEFDPLMVGFKRAHRLVEKEQWTRQDIAPTLFQHSTETALYNVLKVTSLLVPASIVQGDYAKALEALVLMRPVIDGFFEGVLVNTDDPALRANRLSLLYAIDQLFLSFADFSQIVVQGT